ncbi:uncharacterized protein [Nicotiana tomentosiformis]|uniref:uncharacterized protein n=1 Tax=Nicotiana tomentosiformis TaxID=4098 RepID=UPI00388C9FE8
MRRFCLKLRVRLVQQGQQPMITAPFDPPVVRPPRGGGQVGRGCPRGGGQLVGALARFNAFLSRSDAEALDAVIIRIISVCESLSTPVYVSIPVGDSIIVDQIYRSCVVTFCGYETRVVLLLLDMTDFEIILGMDWLSPYHVVLNFHAKTVTLAMPEFPRLEWKGSSVSIFNHVISFLKSRHVVEKGCLAYLAYVRDTTAGTPTIDSMPVVREFSDVFP